MGYVATFQRPRGFAADNLLSDYIHGYDINRLFFSLMGCELFSNNAGEQLPCISHKPISGAQPQYKPKQSYYLNHVLQMSRSNNNNMRRCHFRF